MKKLLKMPTGRNVIASTLGCVAVSLPLFLAACGDETTNNVTETTGMSVVKKGDKTPDCTAENAGEMVYVTDSAAAFFCADGKWQSLKGEKGEQGIQGEQGPQGEPGEGKQGPKGEGKQGAPGESCTAQKLASGDGYKIVCGGDSVGVVLNGVGTNGTSCDIDSDVDGVVTIKCGTDATAPTATLYKAVCGTTPYDPAKKFCDTRDNQVYKFKTITIADMNYSKTWMAQNLNTATESGSKCYGDQEENCSAKGRLYTWAAAVGKTKALCGYGNLCSLPEGNVQGVCPTGWHLPSNDEWDALITAVGGTNTAGKALKSSSGWFNDKNGDDTYGFEAFPGGIYDEDPYDNSSWGLTSMAWFWNSTEVNATSAKCVYFNRDDDKSHSETYSKYGWMSIRCIKDAE